MLAQRTLPPVIILSSFHRFPFSPPPKGKDLCWAVFSFTPYTFQTSHALIHPHTLLFQTSEEAEMCQSGCPCSIRHTLYGNVSAGLKHAVISHYLLCLSHYSLLSVLENKAVFYVNGSANWGLDVDWRYYKWDRNVVWELQGAKVWKCNRPVLQTENRLLFKVQYVSAVL